jgi:hypothetical protein
MRGEYLSPFDIVPSDKSEDITFYYKLNKTDYVIITCVI